MPPDSPTSFRRETILAVADLYEHISGHIELRRSSNGDIDRALHFTLGVWCAAQVMRDVDCVNTGVIHSRWKSKVHSERCGGSVIESGGLDGLRIAMRAVDADTDLRVRERISHLRCRIADGAIEAEDNEIRIWAIYVDPRGQFSYVHPRWTPWARRTDELTELVVSSWAEETGAWRPD